MATRRDTLISPFPQGVSSRIARDDWREDLLSLVESIINGWRYHNSVRDL